MTNKKFEEEIKHLIVENLSEYTEDKLPKLIKNYEEENPIEDWLLDLDNSDNIPITEDDLIQEGNVYENNVDTKEVTTIQTDSDRNMKNYLAESYANVSNLNEDFEVIRKNMIELSTTGTLMLDELMALVKSTEHPNAFKILADALTSISQINKDLIDIYDKKISIETKMKKLIEPEKNDTNGGGQNYTQNNFYGTTDEIYAMLAQRRKDKENEK